MEFIDSTGHIFSLPSYDDNPINLEYVEGDYVFWLKDSSVSINNYYIKPVRFLIDEKVIKDSIFINKNEELESYFTLEISNNSQFYKLIGPKYLQSQLEQSDNISKPIGLDKSQFVDKLTLDDFYFNPESVILENDNINLLVSSGTSNGTSNNKFYMFPFYVVGYSQIEGTFLNNISIKYTSKKIKEIIVKHTYTRDEYYDILMKRAFSDIKVYSYHPNTQTQSAEPILTIHPTFNSEKFESGINAGFNKYEILYSGDSHQTTAITDNVLSTAYETNDPIQEEQYKRIRNFIGFDNDGNLKPGNLPTDVYHYIYRLENELPSGYYVFEGQIYDGCNYCGSTIGINHDGWCQIGITIDGQPLSIIYDSLYPGDEAYTNTWEKYCVQRLVEINAQYEYNNNSNNYVWNPYNFLDEKGNIIGYTIRENPIYLNKTRDFWFDIDNTKISENANGYVETIEEYEKATTYTYITVGCSFIDECEELIINGKNMGIRLPKEILKAIYNSSYYAKYADEKLLKNKLKELFLNYMNIKGEVGNVKSMINSLKWFGWQDHIEISKLIKTDNKFQNQFILDYFNIENDIKETFKYFNNTNNISLTVLDNKELDDNYKQNYNNVFFGEGKPKLEDLFNKNVQVIKDDIIFYKPYYNFIFNELALKLDCLRYYYQQYFLPVHININRASIAHKVYANTTKFSTVGFTTLTEKPIYLPNNANNVNVIFPDTNKLLFMQTNHIIDDRFNEFNDYNTEDDRELYYVNENCVTIPIEIENNSFEYKKHPLGQYILEQNNYIKIEYFYKYIMGNYELITDLENDLQNATHYSLLLYSDIRPLESIIRYNKISKQYSEDEFGDYYKDIDDNYIRMNYFYEVIDDNTAKLSDRFNATHYSLVKNENICKIEPEIKRYLKISEGYFKCKLILTATTINQNPLGHYVKIDGKYSYKENFYVNDFTDMEEIITSSDINNSGNFIKYHNKFIRINKEDRYDIKTIYLVNNDNFNYYQSSNKYFKNFILIPRLLNNDLDYEKSYFRLSLLVNDKWFNYDFKIITPNIYLDLGRLDYKYEIIKDDSVYYPFRQLRSLSPLRFNAFIYEPDLITIDTLFKDVDENNNTKLLTFIDKLLQMDDGTNNPDQHQMYEFYKKYYSNILKVPYNEKYYNRIHLFDIYDDNNEKLSYNENEDYTSLYQTFFDSNLSYRYQLNESVLYDYYLMHDNKEWYIVAISQYPIASYLDKSSLDIHDKLHPIGNYKIVYADYSIDKFLINRMVIKRANGYNQFNRDDLIVVGVNNNDYQFNIDLNNKWSIQQMTDINNVYNVNSNTNLTIITNNNVDNLYTPGYYNVKLEYTINGLNNILHIATAQYKVLNTFKDIEYPEIIEIEEIEETFSIKDRISDGTILFANAEGKRKYVKDSNLYIEGYHPIGIKIVNAGYFAPNSPAIYMGLRHLSIKDPENGYKERGNNSNFRDNYPYFGMQGIIINIKTYDKICYFDETHTQPITILYPPTDDFSKLSVGTYGSINEDGTPKWPAANNRAYKYQPTTIPSSSATMTVLNNDDTLNMNLLDDTCALMDWDGKANNEAIKNSWYNESGEMKNQLYADWETVETMYNPINSNFSPAIACALRYHTYGTKAGDWYVPSYAQVFFMIYNFKKYSEIFENLSRNYPDDCKPDLLEIGTNAFFTCTLPPTQLVASDDMWDIHVCIQVCHTFSRTANWYTIPFINIDESDKGNN